MYEVHFYVDKQGRQPVKEDLMALRDISKTNKKARMQYEIILAYIRSLEMYGTKISDSVIKYIGDGMWELKPMPHQIFLFCQKDNKFILIHHFVQKARAIPIKEMAQAQSNLQDFKERTKR